MCLQRLAAGSLGGQAHGQFGAVGQELVQRRVEQTDRDRPAVHRLKDLGEVLPLERQQRGQGLFTRGVVGGRDHCLDQAAALAEEHVLGSAQADALRAEGPRPARVLGCVGIGSHLEPAYLVGVVEQSGDRADDLVRVPVRPGPLEMGSHR